MSTSTPIAHFDELRSTLHLNGSALEALTTPASPEEASELAVGLAGSSGLRDGHPIPTMLGIVDVLARPARSTLIERFVDGAVSLLFVSTDTAGRYILTDPQPELDETKVMATSLSLVPALLRQSLRLHGAHTTSAIGPISTSVQNLDDILSGQLAPSSSAPAGQALTAIADQMQHAWRASGSWADAPTDSSMTVLAAGSEGLWSVEHPEQRIGGTPQRDTEVMLTPRSSDEVIARLGDVVTGRKTAAPNTSPSA